MTYFNDQQNTNTEGQPADDFVKQIVAEKGDQWADPQVIAKGYAASQEHIAKLELELKAAQGESQKNDYMKEILAKIEEGKKPPSTGDMSSNNTSGAPNKSDQTGVSAEQIKELVREAITAEEAGKTARQNLLETDAKLTELFGTEVDKEVEKKRVELGMDKASLMKLAEESPTAFFALIGKPQSKETNSLQSSHLNTSGINPNAGVRNHAYYSKLRKENPKQYRSATVQEQMLQDRLKLGADKYYN